jgi:hypothetical protein
VHLFCLVRIDNEDIKEKKTVSGELELKAEWSRLCFFFELFQSGQNGILWLDYPALGCDFCQTSFFQPSAHLMIEPLVSSAVLPFTLLNFGSLWLYSNALIGQKNNLGVTQVGKSLGPGIANLSGMKSFRPRLISSFLILSSVTSCFGMEPK